MRTRFSLIFLACIVVCGEVGFAQAISQGVLLNQQSMDNARNANAQQPRIIAPTGSASHTTDKSGQPNSFDPTATPPAFDEPGRSKQPFLSEYAGYVMPGTELTISSPIPGAVIYYTVDGWTPTEDSLRYAGPITIKSDTRVQALAVEPGMKPS